MQTLLDVVEQPRSVGRHEGSADLPSGYPTKATLNVPSGGKIALPKDAEGLSVWLPLGGDLLSVHDSELAERCRTLLLTDPSFVIRLPAPVLSSDAEALLDPKFAKVAKASAVLTAIRVDIRGSAPLFGVARTELVENGLGFGRSMITSHEECWEDSIEDLASVVTDYLPEADASLLLGPEPGAAPWKKAVLVLAGHGTGAVFDADRRVYFRRVAGLFRVDLAVVVNAHAQQAKVIAQIRKRPPDGLLIMKESLANPYALTDAYLKARPSGYAQEIASGMDDIAGQIEELCLHLVDLLEDPGALVMPVDWSTGAAYIAALEGPHFRLTERARDSLIDNPYPKPSKMCDQLTRLAELALAYREAAGDLGARLDEYAKTKHRLNLALFDNSRQIPNIKYAGVDLDPHPHVQVDDATTFDKCGRVYFARDEANLRFVVDHIGLHDYGH